MAAQAAIFMIMKKETLFTFACIIFVAAFAYFGLPMFTPRIANPSHEPFWSTSLSEQQDLQVFDLTLNSSTLQDAIDRFGNRITLTLYETDQGDQVEGYFRETQVGPFVGRMAFTLNADPIHMDEVKEKAEAEKAPMSRHNSYKVPPELANLFKTDTLFSLAFIPTHVVLTPEDVKGRFGEPALIIEETFEGKNTGTQHFLYPEKGVDVSLDQEKRSIIQYISPRFFADKIIAPIQGKN
ncbi:hypothetical protein [Wohlfahrtiimonas chitiniclastica]|uniref:hypothetical protein n=1 Tax=Wohlfahrtiimonas chitiniclastica TaxID=400946 RepID=UPI00036964CF|nr:hypothetical protein [Wohlfahrtiimonas chitiniclastica]